MSGKTHLARGLMVLATVVSSLLGLPIPASATAFTGTSPTGTLGGPCSPPFSAYFGGQGQVVLMGFHLV